MYFRAAYISSSSAIVTGTYTLVFSINFSHSFSECIVFLKWFSPVALRASTGPFITLLLSFKQSVSNVYQFFFAYFFVIQKNWRPPQLYSFLGASLEPWSIAARTNFLVIFFSRAILPWILFIATPFPNLNSSQFFLQLRQYHLSTTKVSDALVYP